MRLFLTLFIFLFSRKAFLATVGKSSCGSSDEASYKDTDFSNPPRIHYHFLCERSSNRQSKEEYDSMVQRTRWLRCPFCGFTAFSRADAGNMTLCTLTGKRKSSQVIRPAVSSSSTSVSLGDSFEWTKETRASVAALLAHLVSCHSHFNYTSYICPDTLSLHVGVRRKNQEEADLAPVVAMVNRKSSKRRGGGAHSYALPRTGTLSMISSDAMSEIPPLYSTQTSSEFGSSIREANSACAGSSSQTSNISSQAVGGRYDNPTDVIVDRSKRKREQNNLHNVPDGIIQSLLAGITSWPLPSLAGVHIYGKEESVAIDFRNSNGLPNSLFNDNGTLRIERLSNDPIQIACFSSGEVVTEKPKPGKTFFHRSGNSYDRKVYFDDETASKPPKMRKLAHSSSCSLDSLPMVSTSISSSPTSALTVVKPALGGDDIQYSYDSENDDPEPGLALAVLTDAALMDFTDVTDEEKIFMSLWNMHARSFPPYSTAYLGFAIQVFARRYAPVIVKKKLRFTFLMFLMFLWRVSQINIEIMHSALEIVDNVQVNMLEETQEAESGLLAEATIVPAACNQMA